VREHERVAERGGKVDGDRGGSTIAACDQRARLLRHQPPHLVGGQVRGDLGRSNQAADRVGDRAHHRPGRGQLAAGAEQPLEELSG
jgi:hypothetical protein